MRKLRNATSSVLSAVPGYREFRFKQKGGSQEYWEARYRQGGNSGDGAYGRLAEFKAQILNDFVSRNRIQSVIEFGCGDGNQLSLAKYPSYLGMDVSQTAVQQCAARFSQDCSKSFMHYNPRSWFDRAAWITADAAISLEVVFLLVEDDLYWLHLQHLFAAARRFVVIYSSDSEEPPPNPHVRPRHFTGDVSRAFPEYRRIEVVNPPWQTDFAHYAPDKTPSSFHFFERGCASTAV